MSHSHARRSRAAAILLATLAIPLLGSPLAGQLRPLEPTDWSIMRERAGITAALGAGVFHRQRASLAGAEGRLVEAGNFSFAWHYGRITLLAGGTLQRLFDVDTVYADPDGGATHSNERRRRDSGDYRISTVVRLTPATAPGVAGLRFGVRLPTTDNKVGLDRDQTDFFALIGGELRHAGFSLAAEGGLGIHGTRSSEYEQVDVILYSAALAYPGSVTPRIMILGQHDGNRRIGLRGVEDLQEVRAGVRFGERFWLSVDVVHGLLALSPDLGLIAALGLSR